MKNTFKNKKADFTRRNIIGVKSMIEEMEEEYIRYKELVAEYRESPYLGQDMDACECMLCGNFEAACYQLMQKYIEKGVPEDLAEDVAQDPQKSIERLHDGSYAEYWGEMARTGHYREIEYLYSIESKWHQTSYWFETLKEAREKLAEIEKECRKLFKASYEEDYYRIIDLATGKEVE